MKVGVQLHIVERSIMFVWVLIRHKMFSELPRSIRERYQVLLSILIFVYNKCYFPLLVCCSLESLPFLMVSKKKCNDFHHSIKKYSN